MGDSDPTFRRDGLEVYFTRAPAGAVPQVMAVSVDGGEARPLIDAPSLQPAASPVDESIVYLEGDNASDVTPMWLERPGGRKRPLSPALARGVWNGPRFSPDGKRVALIGGSEDVVEVDVASGRLLRKARQELSYIMAVLYVAKDLMVVRARWIGDVWIADKPF
jgi:hypothetical protein